MQDNSKISILDLSKELGISSTAIEKNIAKLKEKGILERIGRTKAGYWKIINKKEK